MAEEERNPNLSNPNLTGDAETMAGRKVQEKTPDTWATREHPERQQWIEAELRQRASYIATTSSLSRFLVPHRVEGDNKKPQELRRAAFGFGIGLNAMFVQSIMGHLRSTEARRVWGPLSTADGEEQGRPEGGVGQRLWDDATLGNTSWVNFFNGTVLEWMLTSVGGWVLVDSSNEEGRPKLRFFPWSAVEDYGWGETGLRWIKFAEVRDVSEPNMDDEDDRFERRHLLYELKDSQTVASRWNDDADQIGDDIPIGELVDFQGQPTLPLVPVGYGAHPDIDHVAAGLLLGLDDIVIDAYNQTSEIREAYRDFAFTVFKAKGDEDTVDNVEEALRKGSRLFDLGNDENADVQRLQGSTPEVAEGLQVIDTQLKAWALSARRKSVEAMEGAQARSGVSLKAEFQLDEKPLLVTAAEKMDEVESLCLFLAAQVNDESFNAATEDARRIGVTRSKEFQLEEEPSRISRLVQEYREAFGPMDQDSPAAAAEAKERWMEAADIVDLDAEVEMESGEMRPLREVVAEELERASEQAASSARNARQGLSGLGRPPVELT